MSKKVICFFLALFFIRILFLIFSPLELSPDEAYYWDWSRRPDLCYYSKPPMVAWLIGISTKIVGPNEIGVRLPAAIMGVATAFFLFLFGKKVHSENTGLLAAILYTSTLGSALSSYIMTIDAPLLFFWSGAMFYLWSGLADGVNQEPKKTLFLAGLFTGLGLLSKQTMIAVPLMVAAFIIFHKKYFKQLSLDQTLYYFVPIILCIIPPLYWNFKHQWITFVHTAHHFEQGKEHAISFLPNFKTFFDLLGSQIGLITPGIFFILMAYSICVLSWFKKRINSIDENIYLLAWYLVFIGFIPLIAIFTLALKQRINANWPAPFYLSLSILAAIGLTGIINCKGKFFRKIKRITIVSCFLGFLLVGILYTLPFIADAIGLSGKKIDPTIRLRGWKALAKRVDDIRDKLKNGDKLFIITRRRQTASELAFYLKDHPIVYRWNGKDGRIKSQYELWEGPLKKWAGKDALIVIDKDKDLKGLHECFKKFTFLTDISIHLGNGTFRYYKVFLGNGLCAWKRQ